MSISTSYELKIPNDSTVSVGIEGLLGGTFAQIETAGTSGAPAISGTVLKSRPMETMGPKEVIDRLGEAIRPSDKKPEIATQRKDIKP
jgi:hypothetical protein